MKINFSLYHTSGAEENRIHLVKHNMPFIPRSKEIIHFSDSSYMVKDIHYFPIKGFPKTTEVWITAIRLES